VWAAETGFGHLRPVLEFLLESVKLGVIRCEILEVARSILLSPGGLLLPESPLRKGSGSG